MLEDLPIQEILIHTSDGDLTVQVDGDYDGEYYITRSNNG